MQYVDHFQYNIPIKKFSSDERYSVVKISIQK